MAAKARHLWQVRIGNMNWNVECDTAKDAAIIGEHILEHDMDPKANLIVGAVVYMGEIYSIPKTTLTSVK